MKRVLSIFIISILGFSCGKIENSNSLDDILYGNITDTGSAQFINMKAVLNGNHCYDCHGSWKAFSEQEFVANGLAVKASLAGSKIYYRLKGATAGPGPADMPKSGLPAPVPADMATMEAWINSIP